MRTTIARFFRLPGLAAALLLVAVALPACAPFDPPGQLDTGERADGSTNFEYGAEASISPFHQEAPSYAGMTAVRMLYPVTVPGDDGKPQVLVGEDGQAVMIVAERSEEHTSELQSLMRIS